MVNNNKIYSGRTLSKLILLFFFFLYLIFPSGSSTTDGWNYAANIKHAGEIFHSHHLLYNAFGYIFCWLPVKCGIEVLDCMKGLNAFSSVLMLLIVQMILRKLGKNEFNIIIISCLVGFSFSVIRFSTENETYIIPLFLALSASYNYMRFTLSARNRYALYSGILATFSVLFHQIYVFWWLGILTGIIISGRRSHILWYLISSLTGPLIYLSAILFIYGDMKWATIIDFVTGDFRNGAQLGLSGRGLFFSGASLFRSFIQMHGYILNMIRSNLLLMIPGIISLGFIFTALFRMRVIKRIEGVSDFTVVHIIIIVLQFLFAVFAAGNAEFMVMIPVLVFMVIPLLFSYSEKSLSGIMAGMAIWNLAYGLIPLHFNNHEAEDFLCNVSAEGKQSVVIASDDQLLKSMIYYRTGNDKAENILKSPALLRLKTGDISLLENAIDSSLKRGIAVYTDCLGPKTLSRAAISEGNANKEFFSRYKTAEVKSWDSAMGKKIVSRVIARL